jgi:hypothetical protein
MTLAFGAVVGGTLFGGLHCLAWNINFPTSGEALAWRICSVMTSAQPLLSIVSLGFWIRLSPWEVETMPKVSPAMRFVVGLTLVVVILVPYVLARLFLPPDVFIHTWSASFPDWE